MHSKCFYVNDVCLLKNVYEAKSFFQRLFGLFAYKKLNPREGLLIKPCSSIHTFFMGYSLSLIFISKDERVLKIVSDIKPFRMSSCKGAESVLETLSGSSFESISVGDKVRFD